MTVTSPQRSPVDATSRDEKAGKFVVFHLADQLYALRLSVVEQIVSAVEITPLPKAPKIVLGVINIRGLIVPVYDIRARFQLPGRELHLSDHFIVARTIRRSVALVVDRVSGVVARADGEVTGPQRISPGLEYIEGVVKLVDGLVFIHDLDTFLSADEAGSLDRALASTEATS